MIYFVATPIGNLGDITLRALEVLRSVDEVFCEDTRHTIVLLNKYDIKKPLTSCHKFNERAAAEKIAALHGQGKSVAVVSDAGMPVISDPGGGVCAYLKEQGIPYTVIPGANAGLCALVLSALPAERFAFLGFLPEKKSKREDILRQFAQSTLTLVLHCAPQDLDKTIAELYAILGNRQACAVREITKIHEEAVSFELSGGLECAKRGEFVLIIKGAEAIENALNRLTEREHILHYMRQGMTKKEAVKRAAKDRGISGSDMYPFSIDIKEHRDD